MAQFDVYENSNKNSRNIYPYLIDIQNPILESITTRIVIPLARSEALSHFVFSELTPELEFLGENLLLLTPQIAAVPARILNNPVGSTEHLRETILGALDFAITAV